MTKSTYYVKPRIKTPFLTYGILHTNHLPSFRIKALRSLLCVIKEILYLPTCFKDIRVPISQFVKFLSSCVHVNFLLGTTLYFRYMQTLLNWAQGNTNFIILHSVYFLCVIILNLAIEN